MYQVIEYPNGEILVHVDGEYVLVQDVTKREANVESELKLVFKDGELRIDTKFVR